MAVVMAHGNAGGNERRALHPFFEKRQTSRRRTPDALLQNNNSSSATPAQSKENREPTTPVKEDKPELNHSTGEEVKLQSSNHESGTGERDEAASRPQIKLVLSPSKSRSWDKDYSDENTLKKGRTVMGEQPVLLGLVEDPNLGRRKRQKTESPPPPTQSSGESKDQSSADSNLWLRQLKAAASSQPEDSIQCNPETPAPPTSTPPGRKRSLSPSHAAGGPPKAPDAAPAAGDNAMGSWPIDLTQSSPLVSHTTQQTDSGDTDTSKVTPKRKVLRLNRNGKLLSSPPIVSSEKETSKQDKGRRRTRKPEKAPNEIAVILKYGSDQDSKELTGSKIDAIMNGSQRHPPEAPGLPPPEPVPTEPLKPTHPFFLGKLAQKPELALDLSDRALEPPKSRQASDRGISMSPKKRSTFPRWNTESKQPSTAANATFSQLGKNRYPESKIPIWPATDLGHIRGDRIAVDEFFEHASIPLLYEGANKAKGTLLQIAEAEDLLFQTAQRLLPKRKIAPDKVRPHVNLLDALRLPRRTLMTGHDLQHVLSKRLSCDVRASSSPVDGPSSKEKFTRGNLGRRKIHPAVLNLYSAVETSSTPFDNGQCDTLPWTLKYAPKCAEHVLQTGREGTMLRDWLRNLVVSAVDKGIPSAKLGGGKGDGSKRKRKRQRRSDSDLNGFVISSEEEADEMDEIGGSEDELSRTDGPYRKKSMIRADAPRSSQGKTQITNAVLISGPSGCGKTALVYAIANELGFEVFEINPGARRSGKDIFDKVGDMTQNHLVHRAEDGKKNDHQSGDSIPEADTTELEVKSGKQGTMNSFFKSKPQSTGKRKSTTETPVVEKAHTQPTQKQSLILLEEVDILFEEDKAFWPAVLDLISQSKRPIILTCNDEDLIPIEDLRLHAILRYNPPPNDLAVDYLLLLAANEGHILDRTAISCLYQGHGGDLRSSIHELDFWCQMAIGDRKGGLEWMMDRWPPGVDVDPSGRKLRVTSSDSYLAAMGWLGRDNMVDDCTTPFDEETELMTEALNFWDVDVLNIPDVLEADAPKELPQSPSDSLRQHEAYTENLSVLDELCGCDLREWTKDLLDSSQPELSDKSLLSNPEGYAFLQADMDIGFHSSRSKLASAIRAFSRPSWVAKSTFKEANLVKTITHREELQPRAPLVRAKLLTSFDPIIELPQKFSESVSGRQSGSFDGPISIVAQDLAPYIRFIVASDVRLEQQRLELSNILSEGGRSGKARTTRASRAALEGGDKATTRKERYFPKRTNFSQVLDTGHKAWAEALRSLIEGESSEREELGRASSELYPGSSAETSGHD